MFKKTTLAYLAGILDGEGHIKLYSHPLKLKEGYYGEPRLNVCNTSKILIDWLYQKFGGVKYIREKEGNIKRQYRWRLRNGEMKRVLPLVIPYLKIKREEAQRVSDYLQTKSY